ncbi:hypothetical protein APUTEX25_001146, partial [Auxenochlorella protothecoides]
PPARMASTEANQAGTPALTPEEESKILQQVEFYFSDSNLPRDAFMLEQSKAHPEGFVPLRVISLFSRMKTLLKLDKACKQVPPALMDVIVGIVKRSSVLALNEDATAVKRVEDLPPVEELSKKTDEQSLYASPFPFDTTLDQLTEFFSRVGELRSVRMRRFLASKDFRGSVFLEFSSPEEAARVAGQSLVFQGAPLQLEPKLRYVARREEERDARAEAADQAPAAAAEPAAPAPSGTKRPREAEAAAAPAEAAAAVEVEDFTPGCCVRFDFGPDPGFVEQPSFGLVKDSFGGKDAGLKYADYAAGATSGVARFGEPEQAPPAHAVK